MTNHATLAPETDFSGDRVIRRIFSTNLRNLMDRNNVSGVDLAKAIGAKSSMVTRWRKGEAFPEYYYIDAITSFFKVTHSEMFKDPGSPTPAPNIMELSRIRDALDKILTEAKAVTPIKKDKK